MRNLSLWQSINASLSDFDSESVLGATSGRISAVAIDAERDVLYVASELRGTDSALEINVWRVAEDEPKICCLFHITTLNSSSSLVMNPWLTPVSSSPNVTSEIVSFKLLPDDGMLVIVTRAGDIVMRPLDEDIREVEVVGSVESGILSATWGPDESLLVLATGDNKLILMTSTFDILSESPLHPAEFGENVPIALGWGAKETQFHGSLGKSAAQAALDLSAVGASPDDDAQPRISWRGDGAFFVVSTLIQPSTDGARARRVLHVYARDGTLQSTGEPVAGLEHALAWRPSGNLIAGTQRFGSGSGDDAGLARGSDGRHDVVFFERNGLRHGEFRLRERSEKGKGKDVDTRRWGYRVKDVGWSADSNVLSLWIEGDEEDVVQLWTTGNYHWYLKQEISAPTPRSGAPGRFTSVQWHPEDALRIILTTFTEVIQRTYAWETITSRNKPPTDTGSVAVTDGINILLTPFRTQNVPPPMSSHVLTGSPPACLGSATSRISVPIHASFSSSRDFVVVLWESGAIELTDLHTRIEPGRGKAMDPVKIWAGHVNGEEAEIGTRRFRQVVFYNPENAAVATLPVHADEEVFHFAALGVEADAEGADVICVVAIRGGAVVERNEVRTRLRNGRLVPADEGITWQAPDGELFAVDLIAATLLPKSHFLDFCFTALQVFAPDIQEPGEEMGEPISAMIPLFIGLSHAGKLNIATEYGGCRTLATNTSSFTVASRFLVFTTTAHVAQFAPLTALTALLRSSIDDPSALTPEWETRRVERGSRIITAISSTMSLVLQMPRGNLETINPRPLVMEIVKHNLDDGNYGKAFLACRKHRIDLNVLVEHNRQVFMDKLPTFVEQVDDVDYINLFLTSIGQGPLSDDVVTNLCEGIRAELERKDLKRYISVILTSHVMKRPPDHEAGLALLLRLRDTEPQLVEDAVRYIIFLVDADRLFDTALGMYDFSLVLMVAQHAQKDPREYLPFLRELRALEPHYQHFRIDDHLGRHAKALESLCAAGTERFSEAMDYVEKHRLYDRALSLWQGTEHYGAVLGVYGDWLFERRDFSDAAFVFRRAGALEKALVAHERALEWQELYELAQQAQVSDDYVRDTAHRIVEDLASKKRHADAARVLLDYAQDVREAVNVLVQGTLFAEARRLITLHKRPELLEEFVHPGALESAAQIEEELGEMRIQLRKQAERLQELHMRKVEQPGASFLDVLSVDI
ncbi:IkappaB kinase complex IKAP component [Amylocystis lapponica]|nr:IkappaB kinase complex IKAP component [Amylocystis lapponica]